MTHPNDTLNGKLLAWERPEDRHLRHKFGYWHQVEERMIRSQLADEGVATDDPFLFTKIAQRIEANHRDDPKPWRDRRGLARFGTIRQQADFEYAGAIDAAKDAAIEALRQIASGHNDPRTLALSILTMLPADNARPAPSPVEYGERHGYIRMEQS